MSAPEPCKSRKNECGAIMTSIAEFFEIFVTIILLHFDCRLNFLSLQKDFFTKDFPDRLFDWTVIDFREKTCFAYMKVTRIHFGNSLTPPGCTHLIFSSCQSHSFRYLGKSFFWGKIWHHQVALDVFKLPIP